MKKIMMYIAMFSLTFAVIELSCSALLFYRYRHLGEIPPFKGEPKLSTMLIVKKAWHNLVNDHHVIMPKPVPVVAVTALPAASHPVATPTGAAAKPPAAAVPSQHPWQSATPRIPDGQNVISDPYPFYVADSELGYSGKPGSYIFTYQKKKDDIYTFFKNKVTVLPDKTRYTGKTPDKPVGNVYVFGDSFVFGEGINDEQTFTYLLQNKFPSYAFHLYAMGGYGTVHAYINYKKLASRITANDIIILAYANYYRIRDVAGPSRLREYGEPRPIIRDDKITHAKASVLPDGTIHIDFVPLFCKYNRAYCDSPDPSEEEMNKVTAALINAIAQNTPAKVFLLHIWGPREDPLLMLKVISPKITIIPATRDDFDYEIKDDIMGYDPHPGPYWHYAIFERVSQFIKPAMLGNH